MAGGHCIKAWSKTQSVVAKSSAESELYSVVKGACEGLGLATLYKDLGSDKKLQLSLDAAAAKGILERQGIARIRHIDVNVLWLQQQAARDMVPLIKIKGEYNGSDLMTKHLTSAVQQGHVKRLNMEFRDGRAKVAAQLHAMDRVEPQGQFVKTSLGDKWDERGEKGQWVRRHSTPRSALFTPFRVPHGPGRKTRLAARRETIGISESGEPFHIIDDWTRKSLAHRLMPGKWTGMTVFKVMAFDDAEFGGDQRRQREQAAGHGDVGAHSKRLVWADVTDNNE